MGNSDVPITVDYTPIQGQKFNVLYDMAHGQSAWRQQAAAAGWRQLASQFEALSGNLTHYRNEIAVHWRSKGGEAFREKMTDVIKILDDYAADIRIFATILDETADAVTAAQKAMDKLNDTREQYIADKEDWRDNGDPSNSSWLVDIGRDIKDVYDDTKHRIKGDSHIDVAHMKELDNQAEAIMQTLSNAYWTANTKRPRLAEYKGPIVAVPILNVPGAPGVPISPAPPGNLPTAALPVAPTAPPPATGPVLAGIPAPPAGPANAGPAAPAIPTPPGTPATPMPPLVPGFTVPDGRQTLGRGGVPKLTPPPAPGLLRESSPQSGPGLPPLSQNARKRSGVIGQRPAAGASGEPALPPPARTGKNVTGKRPTDGPRRSGLPPPADEQARHGTPPTIGNTSRPARPTKLDYDAIGGRPPDGVPRRSRSGTDGPEYARRRRPATGDATPPAIGQPRPVQPKTHSEPPPARRSPRHQSSTAEAYGTTQQENASAVIQPPGRRNQDEQGPAIGSTG